MAGRSKTVKTAKRAKSPDIRVSSGNVFRDLGFEPEEAEHLFIRSTLMAAVHQEILDRGITQVEAAELFGVTQPRISDLMRGKIDLFSIDMLVRMLARAGVRVDVRTTTLQ